MAKRFMLPESHAFSIKALPGHEFTVNFSVMDNDSMLSGVIRGLKNIMGDAVGGSEKTAEDKLKLAQEKLDAFVLGTIGDGKSLSPFESEMRDCLSAWLVARKWKKSAADKYARDGESVHGQWMALCEKNSIDKAAGQEVYESWSLTADQILASRKAAASIVIPAPAAPDAA